ATITKFNGAINVNLSTTYSCVSVWQRDQVEINANDPKFMIHLAHPLVELNQPVTCPQRWPYHTILHGIFLQGGSDSNVIKDMVHCPLTIIKKEGNPLIQ
ncbi:hypothetical protein MJO29_000618, partial [Puccinia striiformis f. sp. tritici]